MKRRFEFKIPIGAAYILIIVIVFALSVFGILAIKSADRELEKAKKTRESTVRYYKADTEAEYMLMQIGRVLGNYYNDNSGVALKVQLQEVVGTHGVVNAMSDKAGNVCYKVDLSDDKVLRVKLNYNIEVGSKKEWDIVSWKLE